jgi:hypothetical protein
MVERTVALCRQLGAGADREEILPVMARAACEQLKLCLRADVTPEECEDVFPLAAAMVVLDTLAELEGEKQITAFTAGEVSLRCGGSGDLTRTARRLLRPWTREENFAFQGVRG